MEYPLYTKYKTIAAKRYSDYIEIKSELEEIKSFSEYYTQNYSMEILLKNTNKDRIFGDSDSIPMYSIFVAIIIKYSRCFDKNSNRRKIILDDDFFVNADEEIKQKHKVLRDVRDKYLAHADKTEFENHEVLIGIQEDGKGIFKLSPKNHRMRAGMIVEEKYLIPLIDEILRRLELKIIKSEADVNEEMQFLKSHSPNFINKIKNGLEINQTDIDSSRKKASSKFGF